MWTVSSLPLSDHISKTVASCFATLRHLRSIRRSLSSESFTRFVMSLVLTRLAVAAGRGAGACAPGDDMQRAAFRGGKY